jgi:hypothetical protein
MKAPAVPLLVNIRNIIVPYARYEYFEIRGFILKE